MKIKEIVRKDTVDYSAQAVVFRVVDTLEGHIETVLETETETQRLEAQRQFEALIQKGMVAIAVDQDKSMKAIGKLADEKLVVFMPQISGG